MAYYYGYQTIDITSYSTFKAAVNGNGFDCDNLHGAQCLDLFMLLNFNLGYSTPPYCKAEPDGYAYEAWADEPSRIYNASDKYYLITEITELKRGDMIINGPTTSQPAGHNAFCDADYDPNLSYIPVLGQNQGGAYFPEGGACANVANWPLDNFLGAFRLKAWNNTPPVPPTPVVSNKSRLPLIMLSTGLCDIM